MKPICKLSFSILLYSLLLGGILFCYPLNSFARKGPGSTANTNSEKATTAGCLNPQASAELNLNNVRALIHSGGDMWWDLQSFARYEIPKGSGKNSLFLGSLWIGGYDGNGQLKIAAQMFRENGPDFYTGPLDTVAAEIDPATCKEYDRLWKITRAEVALFRQCGAPCVTEAIKNWPAIGYVLNDPNLSGGLPSVQYHHAPFIDVDGNGVYEWEKGDYPGYDLDGAADCQSNRTPYLYGDETIFWIFNDRGNIHYETGAKSIGLEVRAQAFAFATNDEVNNMTFYNYEIINRGTTDLFNCYFGVNTDADLGYHQDDYVGCDVMRGFGYLYNADAFDGPGAAASPAYYGNNPPAIGIDFFEGPYADANNQADVFDLADVDTWYALNGLGYNDGIVDNERIGMRRFIYYESNPSFPVGQPTPGNAKQFYNLLDGRWKSNASMVYGGNGFPGSNGATGLKADFMFPGDSDPLHWGTKGADPGFEWTQKNPCPSCQDAEGADRRFVQSAGPFTLRAGAVNDITTGAVWARSYTGDPFASVELVRKADDKAQRLFENCFKVLNGPDAPNVAIQELDRELILYWTNDKLGNNYNNTYEELDYTIDTSLVPLEAKRKYRFQGYLVYQMANEFVTAEERHDLSKARLVAQCDVRDFDSLGNPIGNLVNYYADEMYSFSVPQVEVQGANEGITQSLRVIEDAFATGADKRLVNHKEYYFMVIAYGYNNYKKYDQSDPSALDGQKKPFIASRKSALGAIKVSGGIPHIPAPETYGTVLHSFYGDGVEITRLEGNGNGGNSIDMQAESEAAILEPPYYQDEITYKRGHGPLQIKVVDPLSIKKGTYYIAFDGPIHVSGNVRQMDVSGQWKLLNEDMEVLAVSTQDLSLKTEQLLFNDLNGEFTGLSVTISQVNQPGGDAEQQNGFIEASIEMENPADIYLGFIPDNDVISDLNWILSGKQDGNIPGILKDTDLDDSQSFENVQIGLGGTLAPYALASPAANAPGWQYALGSSVGRMGYIQSVDVVLTPDQSKWTRVPVLEMNSLMGFSYVHPDLEDSLGLRPRKMDIRRCPSVDKNGRYATVDGTILGKILQSSSTNPEDANYISPWGMGWFPGYVISLETGERLNMAFGEDSYLAMANGRDMLFNPSGLDLLSANPYGQVISELGDAILGGKHFMYVFASLSQSGVYPATPRYDAGQWSFAKLNEAEAVFNDLNLSANGKEQRYKQIKTQLMRSAIWTGMPISIVGKQWLSGELRIRMRVAKPYAQYAGYDLQSAAVIQNDNKPLYRFSLDALAPKTDDSNTARAALDLINVVPNPYYAYNTYEVNQLDNRVKITNLPPECTITIYNVAGSVIKRFTKADNQLTSIDWNLTNFANVPISSGIYIIHISVPGVGERTIKWFGVMRPTDLSDFKKKIYC